MKYPQTLAGELFSLFPNENLMTIKKYGCLAFVVMWCLGIEPDDVMAICNVQMMINAKVIDKDCTVQWAKIIPYLTGRSLEKVEFRQIKVLKGLKGRVPVLYKINPSDKGGHWVGVENGKIKFNPLADSLCVNKGRPVEARIMTISGVNE